MRKAGWILGLVMLSGCSAATDAPPGSDEAVAQSERRSLHLGMGTPKGTCAQGAKNQCGGHGTNGPCWCDAACVQYGDCCTDAAKVCGIGGTKTCGGFANLPCPDGKVCVDDPNDSCDPANGGADCGGICVDAAPAKNSCSGQCGGVSADKSCFCDDVCKYFGDCCDDYASECFTRTPASGTCVKNSNDACTTDADCTGGGCGGELCYNPALSSGISTCECTAPMTVAGCGCVAGKCTWYN